MKGGWRFAALAMPMLAGCFGDPLHPSIRLEPRYGLARPIAAAATWGNGVSAVDVCVSAPETCRSRRGCWLSFVTGDQLSAFRRIAGPPGAPRRYSLRGVGRIAVAPVSFGAGGSYRCQVQLLRLDGLSAE